MPSTLLHKSCKSASTAQSFRTSLPGSPLSLEAPALRFLPSSVYVSTLCTVTSCCREAARLRPQGDKLCQKARARRHLQFGLVVIIHRCDAARRSTLLRRRASFVLLRLLLLAFALDRAGREDTVGFAVVILGLAFAFASRLALCLRVSSSLPDSSSGRSSR
jgi:hypothetical protein